MLVINISKKVYEGCWPLRWLESRNFIGRKERKSVRKSGIFPQLKIQANLMSTLRTEFACIGWTNIFRKHDEECTTCITVVNIGQITPLFKQINCLIKVFWLGSNVVLTIIWVHPDINWKHSSVWIVSNNKVFFAVFSLTATLFISLSNLFILRCLKSNNFVFSNCVCPSWCHAWSSE